MNKKFILALLVAILAFAVGPPAAVAESHQIDQIDYLSINETAGVAAEDIDKLLQAAVTPDAEAHSAGTLNTYTNVATETNANPVSLTEVELTNGLRPKEMLDRTDGATLLEQKEVIEHGGNMPLLYRIR